MITLTTDFGTRDSYVAEMKGVVLQLNPRAAIVDISHHIDPQSVIQGAFVLGSAYHSFPKDTIHVAVVDPGVGTDRRPVLLSTPWGQFVAPDNGLLSGVIAEYLDSEPEAAGPIGLPPKLSAVHLTNLDYWRRPVSHTFHGRDIFTPVAAHLSLGVAPEELGEAIDSLFYLPMSRPISEDGIVTGQVIYQDTYGNLVTNIPAGDLPAGGSPEVRIRGRSIFGLNRTFNDKSHVGDDGLIALTASHGYLEVALPNGSAADLLAAGEGEVVQVVTASG